MKYNHTLKYWIIGGIVFLLVGALAYYFMSVSTHQKQYVASMKSYVYHRSDCPHVLDIGDINLITFKTPKEAEEKGYHPCKTCNP